MFKLLSPSRKNVGDGPGRSFLGEMSLLVLRSAADGGHLVWYIYPRDPGTDQAPALVPHRLPMMPARAPLDYPGSGEYTINFSLPLRLSHCRSVSMSSHIRSSSASQIPERDVEPPSLSRTRTIPRGHTTSLLLSPPIRPPNLRPSSDSRIPRPSDLRVTPRERTSSSSTDSSSDSVLEASLMELEELIDVLGTPMPDRLEFGHTY